SPSSCPFSLQWSLHHRYLHSFPTRRSSDLVKFFHLMQSILYICIGYLLAVTNHSCTHYFFSFLFISLSDKIITESQYFSSVFIRSEEHTSELQSRFDLVCRLLLEKKKILIL